MFKPGDLVRIDGQDAALGTHRVVRTRDRFVIVKSVHTGAIRTVHADRLHGINQTLGHGDQ